MNISFLVTSKQVNNYLTGQGFDAASDSNFQDNLNIYRLAAHDKICDYLGYEIIITDYVDEYYDGNGMKKLYLMSRPVTSLTTIKMDDVEQTREDYKLINGDYIYYPDGFFTQGLNNYTITYTAGYTQASMPGAFRMAALKLIALYNGEIGGAGTVIGKSSISDGQGGSESIDFDAEKRILESLAKWQVRDRL